MTNSERTKVEKRFWPKVDKSGTDPDSCWLWLATTVRDRASFHFRGRSVNAARVAWILAYGEIPNNLQVCHTCDNKMCVRYSHLFLGTQGDNVKDMWSKGRYVLTRGEDVANVKLTEVKVKEIRQQASEGRATKDLAQRFGVSPSTIQDVIKRRTWKHVT